MGTVTRSDVIDNIYMAQAIDLARHAKSVGERPFGCIIMDHNSGELLGSGFGTEAPDDPTRHSEIAAIKEACRFRKGTLTGCTIYSTHEPCLMCTGAILHAKLSFVVWGSYRTDLPELFRAYDLHAERRWTLTSSPPVTIGGVLRQDCVDLFREEVADVRERRRHRAT